MSQSMQARVHGKLRQLLDQAVRDGYIGETPIDRVSPYAVPSTPPPDPTRHEERKISLDDANALMATIRKEPRDGLGEWVVDEAGKRHYHGVGLRSLRRAFCTSLIRKKVDVTSAQHLLGHSEPITTLRWYSDDTEDGMREAALQHAQQIMTPADEAEMIQDPDMLEWMQENM